MSKLTTHELKCWPEYYGEVEAGRKTFEIRKDDRGFRVGDKLILREYNPQSQTYTGRSCQRVVTYITDFGQSCGYVVMALASLTARNEEFDTLARNRSMDGERGKDETARRAEADLENQGGEMKLTRKEIEDHYRHMQHQEDECQMCWEICRQAIESLTARNDALEEAASKCEIVGHLYPAQHPNSTPELKREDRAIEIGCLDAAAAIRALKEKYNG